MGERWIRSLRLGYNLFYREQINNKFLLNGTENYIQHLIINHNGREYEREYIYELNHYCTAEINTRLLINYIYFFEKLY